MFADSTIFGGESSLVCKPDVVKAFQACTIGGNSAINAGLYFQPPASDWDTYHPEGWHSKDVQPAIDRLLKRQPAVIDYSADHKTYADSMQTAAKKWLVGSAGYSDVSFADQPNHKEKAFGRPVYNYIKGQRGGPVRTYLQTALARQNFRLITGAKVNYIKQSKGKASAVVVTENGKQKTIPLSSKGRVIVSAGAILSPQVLMYSGIGPKKELSKLAAKSHTPYTDPKSWVVQESVGKGLFDNPNTFIQLSSSAIQGYDYTYANPEPAVQEMYLKNRTGKYTFASQTSVFWTYMPNKDGSKSGVQGTISSTGYADYKGKNIMTLNVYGTSGLLSTGNVTLSDDGKFIAGPSSGVYYSNPRDAQVIATFIHSIFQKLPPSTPKSPAKNGLTPMNLPQNSSIEQIKKYITTPSDYAVGSVQHWSSSCRIGKCVDADTKVIGTENIHVIDASILSPMTVNPQFAVMVAGERGAERILKMRK